LRGIDIKYQCLLYYSLIIICFLLCSCASIPKPPDNISNILELENYLNKLTASGTPPGLSLAVVKNDSLIYCKGFGWADKPRKIKAAPGTIYHWWSCTKIITAIAILQLQEKHLLNINDPVYMYLHFFKVDYPSDTCKKITILNLLNHSSGLPDPSVITLINWIHHYGEPSVNQTDFLIKKLPNYSSLNFEPGDHFQYSNLGYMVLGAIIEKVTGITYEDYIRNNILLPLRMNNTDFVYTNAMKLNEAAGAHPIFNIVTPLIPFLAGSYIREFDWNHIWLKRVYTDQTPPSGLIGSTEDASRLVAAYLNGGELNGIRILSPESLNKMTYSGYSKIKGDDSSIYRRQGIGWQIYGGPGSDRWVLTHDGGGPGFSTKIQLYPDEKLGFILFTNDDTCEPWKIINLAAAIKW
jgi:CubicO group peptidase (beta-lactamase class C family)